MSTVSTMTLKQKQSHAQRLLEVRHIPTVPSPLQFYYRNNQLYSFGLDSKQQPTVGMSQSHSPEILPIDTDLFGSKLARTVAQASLDYVVKHSTEPVFWRDSMHRTCKFGGFWRHMIIKEGAAEKEGAALQSYLIIVRVLCATEHVIQKELTRLINWLDRVVPHRLVGVYYQSSNNLVECHNSHPYGLTERNQPLIDMLEVAERKFRFVRGPMAFFQPNRLTAQLIYHYVVTLIQTVAQPVVLLDICCGTGTIGQVVSPCCPQVVRVLGVDCTSDSIRNAQSNLALNKLDATRFEYHLGTAQEVVPKWNFELDQAVIAVVNPPRRGLYLSLIHI